MKKFTEFSLLRAIKTILFIVLIIGLTGCASDSPADTPSGEENTVAPTEEPTTAPTEAPTPTQTIVPTPDEPIIYGNPKDYSVTYTTTIYNNGYNPTEVWVYLPVPSEWDAQRDLEITLIDPETTSQNVDPSNGNPILYWKLGRTPASGESQEFELAFDFTAYETNTYINPAAVQPYLTESPDYVKYTQAEPYIESDDPQIIDLAISLADGETNPYVLAKIFYDYIFENVRYELLQQGLNGAKYILENKVGECGDYSALFIALCRASGIPARPIVGYWAISGNNQTHVWAEFFLEEMGWIPVDVTIGQSESSMRDYYFGNMDNQRVILSKGFNSPLVPTAPGNYVAPILQCPSWFYWGSGDVNNFILERSWRVSSR